MSLPPPNGSHVPLNTTKADESSKKDVDDSRKMSIEDQFLKAMTGGNGFTVRFVPSNDGQGLNAVPVPDLHLEFRMWLMLLMSLVATVTFTAGHAPPGGFWSADDEAKGYVAGTSVMRDKFHCRYLVFYYSNSVAFFLSLAVIVMLARIKKGNNQAVSMTDQFIVAFLVSFCIASLGTSYIAGSWDSPIHGMAGMTAFVSILFYMSFHWIVGANELIKQKSPSNGMIIRFLRQRRGPPAGTGNT